MALIHTLQLHSVSANGVAYPNVFTECKIPDVTRKYEAYKGGGMDTPVFVDLGGEPLAMEITTAGKIPASLLELFGNPKHNGVMWRWAGWYRDQDSGASVGAEVVVRGRFNIDNPNAKTGEVGGGKIKVFPSYYKYSENGRELILIDSVSSVYRINGVDVLDEARSFLGL
jgi:P2 family phage contractile tail tube protein